MFDITKYVKLKKSANKTYTILRLFLFCGFLFCGFLFAKELIFPSQTFYFRAAIDSLANTISRPYLTEHGTGFDVSTYGEFDTAHISITLAKGDAPLSKKAQLSSRKSYRAFFSTISNTKYTDHLVKTFETDSEQYIQKDNALYPFISKNAFDSYIFKDNTLISKANISNQLEITKKVAGFAPGTLISSATGIFVTDGPIKHAFQDELAVKGLGYDFDNVIVTTNMERDAHKKAKMFDLTSTHPFGTIFFARDSDRTYIYDKNELHKISPIAKSKQKAIIVDEISRTTFDTCTLKRSPAFSRTYSCTLSLNTINKLLGNTYQFIISDMPNVNISNSQITFSTAHTDNSFSQRVEMLKKELSKYYQK